MKNLKKAWITPHGSADLVTLSLESEHVFPEYRRVNASEMIYPDVPTAEHPQKHTTTILCLSHADLLTIREAIDKHLDL